METKQVILVDENDVPRGTMEKLEAHRKGELHRAFSIFIFNSKQEMLLQKRASGKYHSGGLWTNTCCSHPVPGERMEITTHKRLQEEMGFDCELKEIFHFTYKTDLDNELTEHELDHVFIGYYNDAPQANTEEVSEWKYVAVEALQKEMEKYPEHFTVWFRLVFPRVVEYLQEHTF
jgi:isopentenyl-diphosphate delta-isomerase